MKKCPNSRPRLHSRPHQEVGIKGTDVVGVGLLGEDLVMLLSGYSRPRTRSRTQRIQMCPKSLTSYFLNYLNVNKV